jgi:hypothetical protein
MRLTLFFGTQKHIWKLTRILRLIKQALFPREHYEGDIRVRVKREQNHDRPCRTGQNQGSLGRGNLKPIFGKHFITHKVVKNRHRVKLSAILKKVIHI